MDARPYVETSDQSGGCDRRAVRCRVSSTQGLSGTCQACPEPRPTAQPDAGARCRSVRALHRPAGQSCTTKAGRRCPRPAAHQDRAQRGLCLDRRGKERERAVRRFIASMQGRVFLVLIGGIVASALVTASLADREGRRTFAQVRAAHTADRVEQLVSALEAVPPEVRPTLAATLGRGMTAQFAGPQAPAQEVDAELTAALTEEFGGDRTVVATASTSADCVTQSGDSAVDPSNARPCRV